MFSKPDYVFIAVAVCLVALCASMTMCSVCDAEQVLQLPRGEDKLHLSIVGNERQVTKLSLMFQSDAKLRQIRDQVRWHAVETDTAIFRVRYAPNIDGLPTVRLQNPDGTVIYEEYGERLTEDSGALYGAIKQAMVASKLFPWRNRNNDGGCGPNGCNPFQQPPPEQEEPEEVYVMPEVEPEEPDNTLAIVAILVMVVVGAGAGVYAGWRKAHG